MALSKLTTDMDNIQTLADLTKNQASAVKVLHDKAGNDIKTYINDTLTAELDEKFSIPDGGAAAMAVAAYNWTNPAAVAHLADNAQVLINVKSAPYNAKGDGETDDTAAIQAAIDAVVAAGGGTVFVPVGNYLVSQQGVNSYCLNITHPIKFAGAGMTATRLFVASDVPNTIDVIRYCPSNPAKLGGSFEDFGILPQSGDCGRYGIHLDMTDPSKLIAEHLISKLGIEGFSHASIKLTNPVGSDAYFLSRISDCYLGGGIDLERAGDSVQIQRNKIFGTTCGIKISQVTGAALLVIEDNNITSKKGAVNLYDCVLARIVRNQIEQTLLFDGTVGEEGMIYLDTCSSCEVAFNNLNAYGTNIKYNIFIDGGRANKVYRNYMTKGTDESVRIGSGDSHDIDYDNIYASGASFTTASILDAGTGTIGVQKTPTFANDWINWDVSFEPFYSKSSDGMVHLDMVIKSGIITDGTVMFTLPSGFRPITNLRLDVNSYNGATGLLEPGEIIIIPTGEVAASIVKNGRLNIHTSFKAA